MSEEVELPTRTVLTGARPNPFHAATTIRYGLAASGPVRLSVYDVTGRHVATLRERSERAGWHAAVWDGTDGTGRRVAPGIYWVRLKTNDGVLIQQAVSLR